MKIKSLLAGLYLCLSLLPCVSEAGVTIIGGLSHERVIEKEEIGNTYQGVIIVKNAGEQTQEVKVYQTDYLYFFDGRSIYGEPGRDPRSNAAWITFSPKRLTIPPRETATINYKIKVPDDEALTGTYWSMLMVEELSSGSPESSQHESGEIQLGIRQVMRYGIQLVTHIGTAGTGRLQFLKTELVKEKKRRTLQVDIENVGQGYLKPILWAEIYNKKGAYIGRFEGGRLRIYPGTSVRYSIDLSDLPEGRYTTLVIADSGDESVVGAQYQLGVER